MVASKSLIVKTFRELEFLIEGVIWDFSDDNRNDQAKLLEPHAGVIFKSCPNF